MDKELIRMARRVWGEDAILPFKELEEFAGMVALAEREKCARMCESLASGWLGCGKLHEMAVANAIADRLKGGI